MHQNLHRNLPGGQWQYKRWTLRSASIGSLKRYSADTLLRNPVVNPAVTIGAVRHNPDSSLSEDVQLKFDELATKQKSDPDIEAI